LKLRFKFTSGTLSAPKLLFDFDDKLLSSGEGAKLLKILFLFGILKLFLSEIFFSSLGLGETLTDILGDSFFFGGDT
jgi:hypothetical protein